MYYFPFLVLTRHISPFIPQQNPAIVSIFTSIQAIVFQICVSGLFLKIIYQYHFHKTYFEKCWYKTLMAIL